MSSSISLPVRVRTLVGGLAGGEEVCGDGGGLVLDVHGGLVGEEIGGLGLGSVVEVEGLRLRGRWGG